MGEDGVKIHGVGVTVCSAGITDGEVGITKGWAGVTLSGAGVIFSGAGGRDGLIVDGDVVTAGGDVTNNCSISLLHK